MTNEKLTSINSQIYNLRKQLEAAKSNPFLSLPVLDQYENAIYAAIEDLQEAFDEEYQRLQLEKINQGLGLQK